MKPYKVWGETFGYQKRYRLVCWDYMKKDDPARIPKELKYVKVARSEVKTRRLRTALRIVIQEYCDRNWSNRPQSANDARADDDRRSNRPSPTHRFCHSAIFRPITPIMFGFSESADIGLSF